MARVKRGVTSKAKHKKVLKSCQRSMGQKKKYYKSCKAGDGKIDAICL